MNNRTFFKCKCFGYAALKEIRKYYRGLKVTSGYHRVIMGKIGLKKRCHSYFKRRHINEA